jgi:xylulokinase
MGIDLGTQGVRCVISDGSGNLIASHSTPFERLNLAEIPGRNEQSAEDWWNAASASIRGCMKTLGEKGRSAEDVAALSIDGTSGTVLPLDKKGRPLGNGVMYNDNRAGEEAKEVHEACGRIERKMGYRFNYSFSLPRILHLLRQLRQQGEKPARFVHQADYIVGRLCGIYTLSDYSNALKTGYDLIDNEWPHEAESLGISPDLLPRIVAPGAPIEKAATADARNLGLSPQTLVAGGSTDGYASALSTGIAWPGDWASVIGTTFVLKGVTAKLLVDPSGSSYSHRLPSGEWLLGGAANLGGRCLNELYPQGDFAGLDREAEKLIPTGVRCYPLCGKGERFPFVDPRAESFFSGNIYGGRLYAAMMEGIGFAERLALERMARTGCPAGDTIYAAGGASRSGVWLRIRASILNRTIKTAAYPEAAVGSALLAASSSYGTLAAAAKKMIRFSKTIESDPALSPVYDEIYQRFLEECKARYDLGEEP